MFFLEPFLLPAQITQPAVYEIEHKSSDHDFLIISMGKNGLALIRDIEKFEKDKKEWEIIFLDSALHVAWDTVLTVESRRSLLGYDYRKEEVCLVFREPDASVKEITITEVRLKDRVITNHQFKPEINLRFTHFSILQRKAIFGGYLNTEPVLLMYDLVTEIAKVVPGTFQRKVELMDVRTNSNDTFNALFVERNTNSNKKLVVRTYDANGVILVDDVIPIEGDKSIVTAITSALVRDELILLGTWSYGINKQAAGLFSVVVDPFNNQNVNYYNLTDLSHFLDYLKPKKIARIKARAKRRAQMGKPPSFRAYLTSLKVEENKHGFTLLAEAYESPISYAGSRSNSSLGYPYNSYYSPFGYSPYGMGSMPYGYNTPFRSSPYGSSYSTSGETPMIVSSLSFFDTKGNFTVDQALVLHDVRSNTKDPVSDFILRPDTTIMAFKNEKEITIQYHDREGTVVREEKVKPALRNPDEVIQSESEHNSSLRAWYDDYFYIYGYHSLKDNVKKTSRDVFYISKIKTG